MVSDLIPTLQNTFIRSQDTIQMANLKQFSKEPTMGHGRYHECFAAGKSTSERER